MAGMDARRPKFRDCFLISNAALLQASIPFSDSKHHALASVETPSGWPLCGNRSVDPDPLSRPVSAVWRQYLRHFNVTG